MKRYSTYKMQYKSLDIEYFITKRTFFENKIFDVVRYRVRKNNNTIKHLELKLPQKTKLNEQTKFNIEKYIKDCCEVELLKEVLL